MHKHSGRFSLRDSQPVRLPVCVALRAHDVRGTTAKSSSTSSPPTNTA
jgi:hypothetical protein